MSFITIGPRQIAGWSFSIRKPREINFTPYASSGMIFACLFTSGCWSSPIMSGMFGP